MVPDDITHSLYFDFYVEQEEHSRISLTCLAKLDLKVRVQTHIILWVKRNI